ncbi:MAG TPA: SDR family NAD(P)-dependent oxidoreductase, partial [Candidatus Udaeobacter sp.]|nr:SDR family NAD(P)-dependent oxidoreductase [Candidatus Udaeobacter sp.]
MQIDLSNKTALITGATGDLGRVMARTLASCGANIVLHYNNNETKARELQQEITALGRRAMTVQADVTNEQHINQMKAKVTEELGHVDIVVANAVIQYQWTSILEQPIADYVSQFESCVLQSVYLAKAFVPAMIERGGGRVIGINTECSMQNFAGQSAYT